MRTVEQGRGRSVRGEQDYAVVVIIGADLMRLVRDQASRTLPSPLMSGQIEIGMEVAETAKQDIEAGDTPATAFNGRVRQCPQRDEDWKVFYVDQMAKVKLSGANETVVRMYATELAAEPTYLDGDYAGAAHMQQKILDKKQIDKQDQPWYLQEIARYQYRGNRTESRRP